jgi:hypothetical protein
MKLVSKWNGKNYYGIENGSVVEIVRLSGYFYRTKFILGEWLRAVGDALKKSEFTLVE